MERKEKRCAAHRIAVAEQDRILRVGFGAHAPTPRIGGHRVRQVACIGKTLRAYARAPVQHKSIAKGEAARLNSATVRVRVIRHTFHTLKYMQTMFEPMHTVQVQALAQVIAKKVYSNRIENEYCSIEYIEYKTSRQHLSVRHECI